MPAEQTVAREATEAAAAAQAKAEAAVAAQAKAEAEAATQAKAEAEAVEQARQAEAAPAAAAGAAAAVMSVDQAVVFFRTRTVEEALTYIDGYGNGDGCQFYAGLNNFDRRRFQSYRSKRDPTLPLIYALASFLAARRKYDCALRVEQAQISKKKS